MNDNTNFYYFIAFCLAAFIVWVVYESIRNYGVKKVAEKMNFSHFYQPNKSQIPTPESSLFDKGHTDSFTNLVEGEFKETNFRVFDYNYTIGGGKHSSTYKQTVFVFDGNRKYPFFDLEPTKRKPFSLLKKVPEELDIEIGSEKFDKYYILRGGRIGSIKRVFKCEGIAKSLLNDKLAVTVQSKMVMIYRPNKRVSPKSYIEKLNLYHDHALKIMQANT
jgi:hypothetical protein